MCGAAEAEWPGKVGDRSALIAPWPTGFREVLVLSWTTLALLETGNVAFVHLAFPACDSISVFLLLGFCLLGDRELRC